MDYHPSQHHIILIWELWLKSSTACWDLRRLWEAIKDEEFSQRFLALHALSGSDTTSRTYLKGTMKYLKVGSQRKYWNGSDTTSIIIGAGEVIALKMFNIESSSSTSLFSGKTAKAATIAKAVSLPPTSYAAAQHSLRCYHQIQCWLGHTRVWLLSKDCMLGEVFFCP